MSKFLKAALVAVLLVGVLMSTSAALIGCGSSDTATNTTAATAATQPPANVIGDRAISVLASIPSTGDYANNTVTGTVLYQSLTDPAQKAKMYVMDVRSKTDYAKGHIEGANQVEFAQWAAPDNLSKLPKDKKIVVVCYTGTTAAQAAAGLRMLGYDAVVLKGGMNGWAQNETQATVTSDLASTSNPVVTTPSTVTGLPAPVATFSAPSDADYKVLAEKANTNFSSKMQSTGDYQNNTITAATLSQKLASVYVLDVRQKADYAKGHIDGAVNIDMTAVAVPENLKQLPKDKKIVVVCYSGNTAAQVATVLNMLDYDAAVLKYGMMSWDGTGKDDYLKYIQSNNYPVVTT